MLPVAPAKEAVRKFPIGWIGVVCVPSRPRFARRLRMRIVS
jgi:hypothetical protein